MPLYKSLTNEELIKYALDKPGMQEFFPELKEWRKLPRQWIINLLFTYVGEVFEQWVRTRISERNQAFVQKNQLEIELAPEIAAFFAKSERVSSK